MTPPPGHAWRRTLPEQIKSITLSMLSGRHRLILPKWLKESDSKSADKKINREGSFPFQMRPEVNTDSNPIVKNQNLYIS